MAANQSILMRAFRVADGSFYTWRAGAYDPAMDDANPPFPKVDYSDHVQIGVLGGPVARSDASAFALAGMGTPGVPVIFPISTGPSLAETLPGTDCRDFTSITCWVIVTAIGTGTQVELQSFWSSTPTPTTTADIGALASDDAIAGGVSPQNIYKAIYSITAPATLGPFNVPVRGRNHLLVISSDSGNVQGYCIALRHA